MAVFPGLDILFSYFVKSINNATTLLKILLLKLHDFFLSLKKFQTGDSAPHSLLPLSLNLLLPSVLTCLLLSEVQAILV